MIGWVSLDVNDYNRLLEYKEEAIKLAERMEELKKLYDRKEAELIDEVRGEDHYMKSCIWFQASEIAKYIGVDYEVRQEDLTELLTEIRKRKKEKENDIR